MYKLFMAFRLLRVHRTIYFSIAGVALGILTLVVVTSIMGGFRRDMRTKIRGMLSHVVVTPVDRSLWFTNYDDLCGRIGRLPHVVGCAPRIEYDAWLGYRGIRSDVRFMGVDPARERGVSDLEAYFRKGNKLNFNFSPDWGGERRTKGVVTGAEVRGAGTVSLTTARDATTPILCLKDFEVVGRFRSEMADYDSNYVFMDLASAQEFLQVDAPPRINQLAVQVDDYEKHGPEVRRAILRELHRDSPSCLSENDHVFGECGKYRIMTWEQVRRNLLQAVDVERGIMIIIMFLIVVVACFNISTIYTLVVRAKTRDIGILRALGATEGGVTSIFLVSGGLCGLIGSAFGLALGLLLSYNVNEVADFIRVVSREINRMPRGSAGMAASALLAAGAAVVWNWIAFYKQRLPLPWFRILAAFLFLGAAAWFSTGWLDGYKPLGIHDMEAGTSSRGYFLAVVLVTWAILAGIWRLMDRWRNRPGWIFFGFSWTILFSALLLAVAAMSAIVTSILAMNPPPDWRGLELFPSNIYYLDRIPVYVDTSALILIVALTQVVSVIFSIYPALRAAASDPIEAIRDE